MIEKVILVDEKDQEIGTAEKMAAHREGKLHRAFSIFIFNSRGALLLQKRSEKKYHSGGLWSNTCCGHPRSGETTPGAAHRRLKEEMGIDGELEEIFSFTYRVKLANGLFENEYDHVFTGKYDGEPEPAPEEVSDWKFISVGELKKALQKTPEAYTYWLRIAFDKLLGHLS